MSGASECLILCEGLDDRAFLVGRLEHLGVENPRPKHLAEPPRDPWGARVSKGSFAFRTRDGRPGPPDEEPRHKAHAWSHMAGWYSQHG